MRAMRARAHVLRFVKSDSGWPTRAVALGLGWPADCGRGASPTRLRHGGMSAGVDEKTSDKSSGRRDLPHFPGEDFLAHDGTAWLETAEAVLAASGLLAVADGGDPSTVKLIVDVDLNALPELAPADKEYSRRLETRTKIIATNAANAEKRKQLTLAAWTELYTMVKLCTEKNAPVLSREMFNRCDLRKRGVDGGYFDGPLAWRMIRDKLSGRQRTEADKDFYRKAESLQRAQRLPDGCTATEYSKKALAFLTHIRPYLPQPPDDDDTADYLIKLMPAAEDQA